MHYTYNKSNKSKNGSGNSVTTPVIPILSEKVPCIATFISEGCIIIKSTSELKELVSNKQWVVPLKGFIETFNSYTPLDKHRETKAQSTFECLFRKIENTGNRPYTLAQIKSLLKKIPDGHMVAD